MIKNILLTIEYDGTYFVGWQKQPKQRSVQGEIEKSLSKLLHSSVELFATSRTDAGVHAYGQKTNFIIDLPIPVKQLKKAANGLLPPDIRILDAEEVSMDFHARFSAVGKKYVYRIRRDQDSIVFNRNYYLNMTRSLDVQAMKEAAEFFLGTHDFKAFCGNNGQLHKGTVRTIHKIDITEEPGGIIQIEVIGNAFLYKMVRMMTGSLLQIGYGRNKPSAIREILDGQMKRIGNTAKPQGLYLVEVYFNEEEMRNNI